MARPKKSTLKKKKLSAKPVVKKTKKTAAKKTAAKKTVSKQKKKKVAAIPKGYNCVIPYLVMSDAAKAIEFYKKVFDAKVRMRMDHGSKVGHAELKMGDSLIMLADPCPEKGAVSPNNNGAGISIHLYVKDVDSVFKKATSSGAKVVREIQNMFYGDRICSIQDPFGHQWSIATHVEDVTPAKLKKRAQELFENSPVNK